MIADPPQPPVYAMRDERDMDRRDRERERERDRDLDDTAVMRRRYEDSQPPRHPQSSWLDPRLLIQVVTIIITVTAGWVTLGNRLDVLQEKLVTIQGQLPNPEVLELKMKSLEEELARMSQALELQDTWIRNTRERLAEKGWKP